MLAVAVVLGRNSRRDGGLVLVHLHLVLLVLLVLVVMMVGPGCKGGRCGVRVGHFNVARGIALEGWVEFADRGQVVQAVCFPAGVAVLGL